MADNVKRKVEDETMRGFNSVTKQWFGWLAISFFISLPSPVSASAQDMPEQSSMNNIPAAMLGQWRGVIEIQDGVYLALGLNISAQGLTLDSPNQGMFERAPTEFTIDGEVVRFVDQELGAQYEGKLEKGVLVGSFRQARALPLRMHKLDQRDQQRLSFEGTYQGDLEINAQTTLPLRVNIAVLNEASPHGGYLATLDSPAQQSFGLPVDNLQISGEALSFESSILRATYQGQGSDGTYEGTFIQGMPYPMTLKKVSEEEPLTEISKPEPGANGSALAIITRGADGNLVSEHTFFQNHDKSSQYEIGSVTKTMVALLLAKLTEDGVLSENDSAQQWIEEAAEDITLVSLATHHSGLPRLPANLLTDADHEDPYAHYTREHLRSALADTERNPQTYEYSNYGFGLLAESLAAASGQSFAQLIQAELFTPAGMQRSYVALTDSQTGENFMQGYDALGEEAGAWHFQALAGAGAVVADLNDMQAYIEFMMNLGREDSALAQRVLRPRYAMGGCCEQALGWILQEDPDGRMTAWHGGQTGGYSAFVGFYLDGSAGLVWLNAQSTDHSGEMLKKLWDLASE